MRSLRSFVVSRRLPILALAGILFFVASVALAVGRSGGRELAHADEQLSWEAADAAHATVLECPSVQNDFAVVSSPVRRGHHAAHFHLDSASAPWSNGMPRCLATLYKSGETAGQSHYYGFSIYIPARFTALIWELHPPSSLYMRPQCPLAPIALHAEHVNGLNGLYFRIATGDCTAGMTVWPHQELNIPLRNLVPEPTGTWIDFVIHIKFAETPTGVVQVWDRFNGRPYRLVLDRSRIPTTQYCSQCGVRNVRLYQEFGLYTNPLGAGQNADLYMDAFRRGPSFASVAP